MSIPINLTPLGFRGLERFCSDYKLEDVYGWLSCEKASWLIELMKVAPDNDEHFPCGKWATIQQLQGNVEAYAKRVIAEGRITP